MRSSALSYRLGRFRNKRPCGVQRVFRWTKCLECVWRNRRTWQFCGVRNLCRGFTRLVVQVDVDVDVDVRHTRREALPHEPHKFDPNVSPLALASWRTNGHPPQLLLRHPFCVCWRRLVAGVCRSFPRLSSLLAFVPVVLARLKGRLVDRRRVHIAFLPALAAGFRETATDIGRHLSREGPSRNVHPLERAHAGV